MDVDVKGDPGTGNTFQKTDIQSVGNYNPAATTVNTYNINRCEPSTRMASDFERLREEILKDVRQETIEELKYYITKLPGTKDTEAKLSDGGFRPSDIREAVRLKELYAHRALLFQNYPSAQQITFDLFSRIKHEFDDCILPLIEQGYDHSAVMQEVRARIVRPIMQLINDNGAADEHLHYSEDHIYGMIYYLTGMCHLNWTDYDV